MKKKPPTNVVCLDDYREPSIAEWLKGLMLHPEKAPPAVREFLDDLRGEN
jgi:hypothetical protein